MNKLATVLLCANFITVLFPQPGYIHPDEFFQSAEVVAGDVFNIQHFRTWEFNGTSAVRNIVFPYLVLSPSLYLLRWLNSSGTSEFQVSAVKVVMATRLPVALLSLLGYVATGRLADCFHADRYISSILYCSSYVTWTYYTRTFSNSVESVLLAAVLVLVLCLSGDTAVHLKKNVVTFSEDVKCKQSAKPTEVEESGIKAEIASSERKPIDKVGAEEKTIDKVSAEGKPVDKVSAEGKPVDKVSAERKVVGTVESSHKTETNQRNDSSKKSVKKSEDKNKNTEKNELEFTEMKSKLTAIKSELSQLRSCISKLVSFLLGALVTAGFFNRPTFLVFTAIPVLYWVWTATKHDQYGRWYGVPLISIVWYFTCGALFTFVTFVLLDTAYFNDDFTTVVAKSWRSCIQDGFSMNSAQNGLRELLSALVVTPWNFIKYNTDSNNLARHGLHPWFTHLVVNLPLLLGPLYIPFIISCVAAVIRLLRSGRNTKDGTTWLCLMALVPVFSLSIFPHQEPRFLIPALPVFVIMGAKLITPVMPGKLSFFALWTAFNIVLTLVYGYMHQAAIIPALSIYQQKLSSPSSHSYHAIFYKTYPPPRHLLLLHPNNTQASIHELAGAPLDTFMQVLKRVQNGCRASKSKCQISIIVPSTVAPAVLKHLPEKTDVTSICPHLTMEDPPRLRAWWKKRLSFQDLIMDLCLNILTVK
ncbi:hypothetical protein BsWGS_22742 [Bradybaena similaris]